MIKIQHQNIDWFTVKFDLLALSHHFKAMPTMQTHLFEASMTDRWNNIKNQKSDVESDSHPTSINMHNKMNLLELFTQWVHMGLCPKRPSKDKPKQSTARLAAQGIGLCKQNH